MFAKPQVIRERRPDGAILLRSPVELAPYPANLSWHLEQWAAMAPTRLFLAERDASGSWAGVTYQQARSAVLDISAWLTNRIPAGRTVAILSDNSVEQGLLTLAAMHVGLPVAPISPAYSLVSRSFAKLKSAIQLLEPAVIFVASNERYEHALAAIEPLHHARLICGSGAGVPAGAISFGELRDDDHATRDARAAAVGPDTVGKLLLTSGSTGEPKAVINTQRMLCASQEARVQIWPFLASEPPVLVDWLPWSHTFGGNHNFNLVLRSGGTLYIDAGRPTADGIGSSVRNLTDIAPTVYFNVPRGFDMLLGKLRADEALRRNFFSRLRVMFCAAAALPEHIWRGWRELAAQSTERAVPLVSAWGTTETAPLATDCYYQAEVSGVIGLPVPGCELKLVPRGEKLEVRVRGVNITPGYFRNPEATGTGFDDEGYYCPGDAVRFVNEEEPETGLLFNGRLSEDFKLSSGTWVHVGSLRTRALAALAPIASDAVVTGHDRSDAGLLIFPHVEACRRLASDLASTATLASVLSHPKVREHVKVGMNALKTQTPASSMHAARAVLLEEPPSIDHGEITDKGYINQRAVLERRQDIVRRLYSDDSVNILL